VARQTTVKKQYFLQVCTTCTWFAVKFPFTYLLKLTKHLQKEDACVTFRNKVYTEKLILITRTEINNLTVKLSEQDFST